MHLPPYLEAKAEPEKLGRGKTGKILVTLDSEKNMPAGAEIC
jgi:hypothetical protein